MEFLKTRLIQKLHELHGFPISYPSDVTVETLKAYIVIIETAKEKKILKRKIAKLKRKLQTTTTN